MSATNRESHQRSWWTGVWTLHLATFNNATEDNRGVLSIACGIGDARGPRSGYLCFCRIDLQGQ